jgi:carboxypeptidase C (cathepsin A)
MEQSFRPSHSHRRLYSISEEITPAEDQILRHGGTSSSLKRLPSRLQQSKHSSVDFWQQIENLVYEVSYLRGELQWQKESKQALLQLQERMFEIFYSMEDALVQVTTRLEESERRYLGLWGVNGENRNSGDKGGMI